MIDLDKERKEFIKVYTEIYGEHDQIWQGWKKRAELAQQEIEATKRELEFATKTINNLLEKLAKYESDDVVVVPREPSEEILVTMAKEINKPNYGIIDRKSLYKAMIEAGEIE